MKKQILNLLLISAFLLQDKILKASDSANIYFDSEVINKEANQNLAVDSFEKQALDKLLLQNLQKPNIASNYNNKDSKIQNSKSNSNLEKNALQANKTSLQIEISKNNSIDLNTNKLKLIDENKKQKNNNLIDINKQNKNKPQKKLRREKIKAANEELAEIQKKNIAFKNLITAAIEKTNSKNLILLNYEEKLKNYSESQLGKLTEFKTKFNNQVMELTELCSKNNSNLSKDDKAAFNKIIKEIKSFSFFKLDNINKNFTATAIQEFIDKIPDAINKNEKEKLIIIIKNIAENFNQFINNFDKNEKIIISVTNSELQVNNKNFFIKIINLISQFIYRIIFRATNKKTFIKKPHIYNLNAQINSLNKINNLNKFKKEFEKIELEILQLSSPDAKNKNEATLEIIKDNLNFLVDFGEVAFNKSYKQRIVAALLKLANDLNCNLSCDLNNNKSKIKIIKDNKNE